MTKEEEEAYNQGVLSLAPKDPRFTLQTNKRKLRFASIIDIAVGQVIKHTLRFIANFI
jgi:hypothetical protein